MTAIPVALLHLIIELSIVKPVSLRHLHVEYYSGAFPDTSNLPAS